MLVFEQSRNELQRAFAHLICARFNILFDPRKARCAHERCRNALVAQRERHGKRADIHTLLLAVIGCCLARGLWFDGRGQVGVVKVGRPSGVLSGPS